MIQKTLQGNQIVITPKFGSNNIFIQFPNLMEAPPLPTLISLKAQILLTSQQDEEI